MNLIKKIMNLWAKKTFGLLVPFQNSQHLIEPSTLKNLITYSKIFVELELAFLLVN